jgi:hypothetical protein
LGEEGEAESRAEMLGIQERGGQLREGGGAFSGGEQDFFLEGVEADGKQESGGEGDCAGDGEEPGRGLQE